MLMNMIRKNVVCMHRKGRRSDKNITKESDASCTINNIMYWKPRRNCILVRN